MVARPLGPGMTATMLPEVAQMLDSLEAGVREILGDNLIGLYVRGSLATGDFIAGNSDIDALATTERPVDDEQFPALAKFHAEQSRLANPYADQVEIAYIDRAALKRFQPGFCHPTLYRGEALLWTEHRENWILERWTVRERGITLLGRSPQELIDPVSPDELRQAVRARLQDWADSARQPEPLPPRYSVETMCRALYTIHHGSLSSKSEAVAWALNIIPDHWASLVKVARIEDNPDDQSGVREFVLWATAEADRIR